MDEMHRSCIHRTAGWWKWKIQCFQGFDFALLLINGAAGLEIERVDGIQLDLRFRQGGRVLDQVAVAVFLIQSSRTDGSLLR